MIYDINGRALIVDDDDGQGTSTDSQCVEAFVAAMNKKAAEIGMTSSNFLTPAGNSYSTQTTVRDMARLVVIASGSKEMAEVWSKNSRVIPIKGTTRTVTVTTTVRDNELEALYPILGGKTGHWDPDLSLVCLCDVDGKQVAGAIHGASTDAKRFDAMLELMNIAKIVLGGGTTSQTVTSATHAIAFEVPTYYPMNYEQQDLRVLYEQGADVQIVPASTTKVLTIVTALDYITDLHKTITFKASDAIGGSGAVFSTGDTIEFIDAMYAILLPSSNMTAQAVARTIGGWILNKYA